MIIYLSIIILLLINNNVKNTDFNYFLSCEFEEIEELMLYSSSFSSTSMESITSRVLLMARLSKRNNIVKV